MISLKKKISIFSLCMLVFSSCSPTQASHRNRYYGKAPLKHIPASMSRIIYGEASYYAEKYHGRKTANGEIYNMNGYTAAHKTLPFNTKLKVTYLKTKRSVVVRINDRGPFIGDRILDLTKQAAKDIGLIQEGVGQVKIEILN